MSSAEWEPVAGDTRGSVSALTSAHATSVFATTPVGVYHSADGGRTWDFAGTSASVPFGEAIAISGDDVYVGAPDGLHHSADGGRTWQHVLTGTRVAAVSAAAGIVLAGTETDGLLRSEDAGCHWTGVNAGLLDLEVLAVALSPTFERDRLAFSATASDLYRSRNGADSWRAVDCGLDEPAVQCIAIGPDRLVVAGTEADGLLCSDDGGTTWRQPADLADRSISSVAVSSQGSIAAATDVGLFVSADGGNAWVLHVGLPEGVLALLYLEDGQLLAGTERSGAWRSEDGGASWTASSTGLHASLLATLAVGPDDTVWVAAPTEGIRLWRDGAWHDRNDGLPDATVLGLSLTTDGHAFAATPQGIYTWSNTGWRQAMAGHVRALSGSHRIVALSDHIVASDDLGETWRTLPTPFDTASVIAFAAQSLAIAVASREASATILWRSDDGGAHWHRAALEGTINALTISPDGGLWVASATGIFVSRDGGATFTAADGPKRVVAIAPPYALELGGRLWRLRDSG